MQKRVLIIAIAIISLTSVNALGQSGSLSPSTGPTPEPIEPVDASYVPPVESKVPTLELVSVVRQDPTLHIKLKNTSQKKIYSLRSSYHKSGQSLMMSFIGSDQKFYIAPSEVFDHDYPYISNSVFARQPITFEAVLFEDGTGDGLPDKVKSLQEVFLRNRRELEHVLSTLTVAIESPQIEAAANLVDLLDKLSLTPDYMYGTDLQGIAGLTLPSWKATAMGLVQEIERAKFQGSPESFRESLQKIKTRFEKSLAKYPRVG
jgi:hypothetical protein